MSFVLFLAQQWRLVAAGALIVAVGWLGFWVNGKIHRAAEADRIEAENKQLAANFKAQVKATFEAQVEQLKLSEKLSAAESATHETVREVTKYVRQNIRDDRACDLPPSVLSKLNQARGWGDVPAPAE